MLISPCAEFADVLEVAVELPLHVVAVEDIGEVLHALDGADLHVDRRAHLDLGVILLDGARNERRGGRGNVRPTDASLDVVEHRAHLVLKPLADRPPAVAGGVEEQIELDAHLPQPHEVALERALGAPVGVAVHGGERGAAGGHIGPGEVDLRDVIAVLLDDLDDRLGVLPGELIADCELHDVASSRVICLPTREKGGRP